MTFNNTAAELERSVGELRRMEANARRFVADVSHELRTPLAAMTAVTDTLDEEAAAFDGDAGTAARLVSTETRRLAQLVENLIEISRFDAGRRRSARRGHRRGRGDRRQPRRPRLDRQGADRPAGRDRGRLDRRRLDVIVANLVGNALRHGAAPVTVRQLRAAGSSGDGHRQRAGAAGRRRQGVRAVLQGRLGAGPVGGQRAGAGHRAGERAAARRHARGGEPAGWRCRVHAPAAAARRRAGGCPMRTVLGVLAAASLAGCGIQPTGVVDAGKPAEGVAVGGRRLPDRGGRADGGGAARGSGRRRRPRGGRGAARRTGRGRACGGIPHARFPDGVKLLSQRRTDNGAIAATLSVDPAGLSEVALTQLGCTMTAFPAVKLAEAPAGVLVDGAGGPTVLAPDCPPL